MDTYLDKKIDTGNTPDQNAANMQKKAHELCQHLDPQDADLLMTRSGYFSQHMLGLCKQKKLISFWSSGDSSAAKVAFAADRQLNLDQALELVVNHVRSVERADQGPHARQAAMCKARNAVAEAVAFPKPPIWDSQLDTVIEQEVSRAITKAPGTRAKLTADQLNSASNYKTDTVASAYFYSKIETARTVQENKGHVEDKLQALLPLIHSLDTQTHLRFQAQACQQDMASLHRKKTAEEARERRQALKRQ